ncbi:MAG: hypothetical protein WC827_03935 [Candidatus Paceibacterota bacterium]|jgi:hypothetical protein
MSITNFIRRVAVQTAVYWGSPVEDGYGGKTYADPVEIPCRWEEKVRLMTAADGSETKSKATVLVTQELDEEGYLYLGTLDSLDESGQDSDFILNPKNIEAAFEIIAKDRIPMIRSTTVFINTVYLGFRNV